jgi:EPS-associated MarR family transcriptional regulator
MPCGSYSSSKTMSNLKRNDETMLQILQALDGNADVSQRDLARQLKISLGSANYCINALIEKGFIKLDRFYKSSNKIGYLYVLTPEGIQARLNLTREFIQHKRAEYARLEQEIAELQRKLKAEAEE